MDQKYENYGTRYNNKLMIYYIGTYMTQCTEVPTYL